MTFDERDEKYLKILRVAKCFLENENITIQEVAEITGIPRSTVQRYLNSELINCLCELKQYYDNPKKVISDKLHDNIKEGKIRGGTNFAINNCSLKTSDGKFVGSRRK